MSILQYLLLFISVILGGGIAFYIRQQYRKTLQWVLSFSGAYILGISVLHLMPAVFTSTLAQPGLWILIGFFIQLLLEQLSQGVEHGHIHAPHHAKRSFAIQLMLGLCVHAFMEGLPLGNYEAFQSHMHEGEAHSSMHLLVGIILHKAPAAFALVSLLLIAGFHRKLVVICLLIFALMSPLGAALAAWLGGRGMLDDQSMAILIAIVIGSFLHIATTIIFEMDSSHHHRISKHKLIAILAGLGVAIATMH